MIQASEIIDATIPTMPKAIHLNLTDGNTLGVDGRCSVSMSHKREDFIGQLQKVKRKVEHYGGTTISTMWKGTMRFTLTDDEGKYHEVDLPDSLYNPDGKRRLLSPQHWSSVNRSLGQGRVLCSQDDQMMELAWDEGRSKLTIPAS